MEVVKFINNPVASNCYVLIEEGLSDCIVIDPGSEDSSELMSFLEKHRLNPLYILLTHHHFDHIWGVECLKKEYPDSKVICSEACDKLMVSKNRNLSLYYNTIGFESPGADISVGVDTVFDFHGIPFEFHIAKGHSSSSVLIKIECNLFTGDNLIFNEATVLKLPTSSRTDFLKTIDLLESFKNQNLIVRGGHGDCFDLDNYDIIKAIK